MKATEHPLYDETIRKAAIRALENKGASFTVYFDDENIYQRASTAGKPLNFKVVCVAQYWAGDTVQIRYPGGYCEWFNK